MTKRICPLALAFVAATACAPQRPSPGALAPVAARAGNEARAADLASIDQWEARRVALLRNEGADLPDRSVALARAGAWIAFAREAYVARPHASDADDALGEARRLMAPFEPDAAPSAARGPLAAGADRLSPDNWAEVERLASKPERVGDVASLAEAEIELVRAGAAPARLLAPSVMLAGAPRGSPSAAVRPPAGICESSASALSRPAVTHIARAVALLGEADVVARSEARRVAAMDMLQQDERLHARRVHFAVKSDSVGLPSAALLGGVAGALREHRELSLVIEGHADPRGGDDANRVLSGRRAGMVRDILADSGVAEDRMLVRQFGARLRVSAGRSAVDYARDRRVVLKFVLPNGEELAIAEDSALDLQIERAVTRSAAVRRRKPARTAKVSK
jgi:outer membrane protein OmpA-like peptidoglycan-associated protein